MQCRSSFQKDRVKVQVFLKLPVNEGVLGVLQGIKVEQTYDIWWKVVPDKLLHGVHPAENLFEKLIIERIKNKIINN